MATYTVILRFQSTVEVEAESEKEAIELAEWSWNNSEPLDHEASEAPSFEVKE